MFLNKIIFNKTIYYKNIFKKFPNILGFCSPQQLYKKSIKQKFCATYHESGNIELIKAELKDSKIVILLVGHGYNNKHKKKFNILKAYLFQHYISLLHYDNNKKGFYCYDSSVKQKDRDKKLPVGNIFLSEEITKKSRNFGGKPIYKNLFISIKKQCQES